MPAARKKRCMGTFLRLLTEDFAVWGVAFQYWMPLTVVIVVISLTALKERL